MQRLKNDSSKIKKLINIARPLELPPLKLTTNTPATEAKKKPALPLFGKKRTFGFGKPAAVSTKFAPKVIIKSDDSSDEKKSIEEFDDDEVGSDDTNKFNESTSESVAKNQKQDVCERPSSSGDHKIITVNKTERRNESKIDAPIRSSSISSETVTDEPVGNASTSAHDELLSEARETDEITTADKSSGKRKRNRYRNRSDKGRENIDMDDIEEPLESDKYSKWVPPENQSGDGITNLNSKFGY